MYKNCALNDQIVYIIHQEFGDNNCLSQKSNLKNVDSDIYFEMRFIYYIDLFDL